MTMEPQPENIAGEVVHRHAFEHRIEWGHVAVAVAAVVIVVTLFGSTDTSNPVPLDGSDEESNTDRIGG